MPIGLLKLTTDLPWAMIANNLYTFVKVGQKRKTIMIHRIIVTYTNNALFK